MRQLKCLDKNLLFIYVDIYLLCPPIYICITVFFAAFLVFYLIALTTVASLGLVWLEYRHIHDLKHKLAECGIVLGFALSAMLIGTGIRNINACAIISNNKAFILALLDSANIIEALERWHMTDILDNKPIQISNPLFCTTDSYSIAQLCRITWNYKALRYIEKIQSSSMHHLFEALYLISNDFVYKRSRINHNLVKYRPGLSDDLVKKILSYLAIDDISLASEAARLEVNKKYTSMHVIFRSFDNYRFNIRKNTPQLLTNAPDSEIQASDLESQELTRPLLSAN